MNCQTCTEPTKHAVGFWDGKNTHGQIYNCNNLSCEVKQETIEEALLLKEEMDKVDRINLANEISMKLIKDKRKELGITIRKMADCLGVSCSEYSNYEQCREALPIEIFDRIDGVFKENIKVVGVAGHEVESQKVNVHNLNSKFSKKDLNDYSERYRSN